LNAAREQLEEGITALGLEASAALLGRFDKYLRELLVWKEKLSLTAASSATDIVGLHFLDSLLALTVWEFPPGCRVIDVGSGAGFPGIPLKFVRPDLHLALIEATRRRVAFLEHLRSACDLGDVEIAWARAEALAHRQEYREGFGVAVERATARVGAALELCLPFVAVGGVAILLTGPAAIGEAETVGTVAARLGGRVESCEIRALPTTDRRRAALVVRKTRPSPAGFPRRTTQIGRPM
jgi:16S rRNA (guanine527-N7)-methyltransferase